MRARSLRPRSRSLVLRRTLRTLSPKSTRLPGSVTPTWLAEVPGSNHPLPTCQTAEEGCHLWAWLRRAFVATIRWVRLTGVPIRLVVVVLGPEDLALRAVLQTAGVPTGTRSAVALPVHPEVPLVAAEEEPEADPRPALLMATAVVTTLKTCLDTRAVGEAAARPLATQGVPVT